MAFHLILALFTLFIIGRQIEGEGVENSALEFWIIEIWSIAVHPTNSQALGSHHTWLRLKRARLFSVTELGEEWRLVPQFCLKPGLGKPNCSSMLGGVSGLPCPFLLFQFLVTVSVKAENVSGRAWELTIQTGMRRASCSLTVGLLIPPWSLFLLPFCSDEIRLVLWSTFPFILKPLWFLFSPVLCGPNSLRDAQHSV